MSETRVLRWGILGAARIALRHVLPAFGSAPHAHAAAIAARDPRRARAAAEKFGIGRTYETYEALLADPDIDAVYVPLPNDLHMPWTVRALEAGKHVLCEKPIALDAGEARAIAAAAAAQGSQVAEAYMIRFHPQWQRAKALAAAGALGELRAIQCWFAYDNPADELRNSPRHGGGGLYDIGGYALVAARWLFGTDPLRLIGSFHRESAGGVDCLMSGLAEFPGGRQLGFGVSTRLPRLQTVIAHGTRARLTIETPFNAAADRPTRLLIDDGRDLYGGGVRVETIPPADQYALQLEAFSLAVLEGRPPLFGIDDALVNMRAVDALFRSERSGAWERP
ncbi:MAG TPA: Gfo/Idh/MocA family oxidoreductase [Nitrolancea sp.]|jgi:predicted dehydrogenase|nr:Gfo/Idh/MocA family oxidoreductase [Nitrolancea sp.]